MVIFVEENKNLKRMKTTQHFGFDTSKFSCVPDLTYKYIGVGYYSSTLSSGPAVRTKEKD